jgi:IMP dehydrogenase
MVIPTSEQFSQRFIDGVSLDFDDVAIVPAQILTSTDKLDLRTRLGSALSLSSPFLVKALQAERAIAAAQAGLLGIISHQLKPAQQAAMVRDVKRYQTRIVQNPITVTAEASVAEVIDLQKRYDISGIPVIDETTRRVVGLVTRENIRPDTHTEQPVSKVMTQDGLIMLQDSGSIDEVEKQMRKYNVKRIILTDRDQHCIGMVTAKDLERINNSANAIMDNRGRLRIGASIGTGAEHMDRVTMLIDEQVDILLVEGEHVHSKALTDMVTHIRRQRAGHVDVIAGPVMTSDAAHSLMDAGASAVFMNPAPPAAYHNSGIGLKAFSALLQVADATAVRNVPVFFDGLKNPEHRAKAFVGGANGLILGDEADAASLAQELKRAMQLLGCATLAELRTDPRFVRLK